MMHEHCERKKKKKINELIKMHLRVERNLRLIKIYEELVSVRCLIYPQSTRRSQIHKTLNESQFGSFITTNLQRIILSN